MKRIAGISMVFVLFVLLLVPAIAQDVTITEEAGTIAPAPAVEETAPPVESIGVSESVFVAVLVLVVLLVAVNAGTVFALYRSTPPVVQDVIVGLLLPVVDALDRQADKTRIGLDDEAVRVLREYVDELKAHGEDEK